MSLAKFIGTGVAIITPFREDKSIDFKSFDRLIDYQIDEGIDYIVVLGTTGENVTLSKEEKKAVISFVIEKVNRRVPVVVGIGGNNTNEILHCIKDTDFNGIDAILSVSPYYNKPSQYGLYEHYKAIACASPVPVILYNVPGRTSSNILPETVIKISNEFNNIIAIKEASGDLIQIMNIINNKRKEFLVISGDDAFAFPIVCIGGSGVISVIANAFPKLMSTMIKHALQGEYEKAREIHYKLFDIIRAIFAEGSPAGIKAVLEILGISKNYLRLPLTPVSKEHYSKLETLVKKLI